MIAGIPFVLAGQLIHLIIFIFSNPIRYDVKAGTIRKNEYK